MVNIALADAVIAAWYGKYKFAFWRPLTAIQNADDDGKRRNFHRSRLDASFW